MSIDRKPAGGAKTIAVVLAFTLVSSGLVQAAGVTMQCSKGDVANPMWAKPISFAFEDGARALKVGGTFGEFEVPASRQKVQTKSGGTTDIINANAKVHVKLPALADVEACIGKVPGALSAAAGSDAFLDARDACLRKLPAAASGVDAVAQIRLGIIGDPGAATDEDAYVLFKLIYDAQSRAAGGQMEVEAFPANCILKK